MHAWCLWRSKEDIGFPGNEITQGCELLCGYQEKDVDPLQEQSMNLSVEASLQQWDLFLLLIIKKFVLGMVVHSFTPSTQEAEREREAGGSL